jgi:CBS domain-containing protein
MHVRDVMTDDVVTVEEDASLQRAVGEMLKLGIGSVLVTDGDRPVGILTDSDVLRAGYLSRKALPDISVGREMSEDLVTVHAGDSLDDALALLREHDIKKLPVEDDAEVVGIVTMTDLAHASPDAVEAAQNIQGGGLEDA